MQEISKEANHSLTLDLITEADFFQKQIYPPFNATVVSLNPYLCPYIHPCNIEIVSD